jgi:flavin-dependent dehydrogenase
MRTHHCDVLIVGAGPAGTHLASLLGRAGISVIILDKNPAGEAGATWINGVPLWMFEASGLDKPLPQEVHGAGARFTLIDPTHQARVSILAPFFMDLDMRVLGTRLLNTAENTPNVRVFHQILIQSFDMDSKGRPRVAYAKNDCFKAELFVDVSGLSAVVRKNTPFLKELCPAVEPADLCRAAQEVRQIKDPHGALSFLETHQAQSGEILSWVGVAGGYSLFRVQIAPDLRTVSFLTGTRALFGVPSGAKLIQNFLVQNPWVGDKILGGGRAIPLRYPYGNLVAPGVALLGDSACQVYAAHGSGIGIGLLAAKQLAVTVIKAAHAGLDLGSLSALWPYAYHFHNEHGSLLATADLTRRFSQALSPYEVHQMIASGMMTEGILKSSLLQEQPKFSWSELSAQMKALVSAPSLAAKLALAFAKLPKILWATRQFPKEPDLPKVLAFETRLLQWL